MGIVSNSINSPFDGKETGLLLLDITIPKMGVVAFLPNKRTLKFRKSYLYDSCVTTFFLNMNLRAFFTNEHKLRINGRNAPSMYYAGA